MRLIPQPQKLTMLPGAYRLTYRDRITLEAGCPGEAVEYALLLSREIKTQTGLDVSLDRRLSGFHPGIHLHLEPSLGAEGTDEAYTIDIATTGVTVKGAGCQGLLHAVQTLRQMLRQEGAMLPCLHLEDAPALPIRGLFYDVTRCRIPTMDFLKELVDKCSFYKLNQLHLYVEHTFLFDGFSEIWRDDTPLTAQDILELDAYCRARNIDLVPSVATLGHLYKVLRTGSFHHLSELEEPEGAPFSFHHRMGHHTLNVTDPDSLKLVFDMIDQFLPLFSSKRFNINGDEPFDLGQGRGKALAGEIGSHEMYVEWIGKICRHVESLGKQPMFWGDVILADPDTIHRFPKDIICMNWDYAVNPREESARKLAATGVAQYLCPGVQGWKQTINLLDEAYANISKMAQYAHKYRAQGLLVTEWGDYGHLQDPESSLPGIIYAAAMGWNPELPTQEALDRDISLVEYGDPTGQVLSIVRTLSRQVIMNWGEAVEFTEIQRGRLPETTMERFWQDFLPRIERLLPRAVEANETIDRCQNALCKLMPGLREPGRLVPYLMMSDGQKLLNRLMAWLEGKYLGRENTLTVDPTALARELECWYNDYKRLWRTTSRESELYRNGEVIFWLADFLRREA